MCFDRRSLRSLAQRDNRYALCQAELFSCPGGAGKFSRSRVGIMFVNETFVHHMRFDCRSLQSLA